MENNENKLRHEEFHEELPKDKGFFFATVVSIPFISLMIFPAFFEFERVKKLFGVDNLPAEQMHTIIVWRSFVLIGVLLLLHFAIYYLKLKLEGKKIRGVLNFIVLYYLAPVCGALIFLFPVRAFLGC